MSKRSFKVGFTGSRDGLSQPQKTAIRQWLKANPPTEIHHGGAIGADGEFAEAAVDAVAIGEELPNEVCHPSNLKGTQMQACTAEEIRKPLPPLKRNQNIVNSVDVMLASPKGPEEVRSGTWSTIRFAKKQKKPLFIFWPDGTVEEFK